jgi:hypothetical protein
MGLGKSLSMIALLTHGIDPLDESDRFTRLAFTNHRDVNATLLIVPPSRKSWQNKSRLSVYQQ